MAERKRTHLSPSRLNLFLECPRKYFYNYYTNLPHITDLPRLCGIEVHRLVAKLHEPVKDSRPFYYQTQESALKAWRFNWQQSVEKAVEKGSLGQPEPERFYQYMNVGAKCIKNYWDGNISKPSPIQVEKRYNYFLTKFGVDLVGIVDQVREVPISWIASKRPELIQQGRISPQYDPVMIVDLKTNYADYDAKSFKQDPSILDWIRKQYTLHENVQATAYTLLYQMTTGKLPVGFAWYHLRSGRMFPTFRTAADYPKLFEKIDFVLQNEQSQLYPTNEGKRCESCDFVTACRGERPFYLSMAQEVPGLQRPVYREVLNEFATPEYKQNRLKISVPRVKKGVLPEVPKKLLPEVRLFDEPWGRYREGYFDEPRVF